MSDEDAGKLKGLFPDSPSSRGSHVLGRISPGHTFALRQNAAAQAEQRGESEPRHEAGRHRVCEAPGEAPSFHGNGPVFRFTQTLGKGVLFFIAAVKESFFLAWETLTAPPPRANLQLWARAARGHALLDALTSRGGRTDAAAQVDARCRWCLRFDLSARLKLRTNSLEAVLHFNLGCPDYFLYQD